MSSRISYEDAFNTTEYKLFQEAMSKVSLDNKLLIKDNHIVVGKNKYNIPYFINYQEHLQDLEKERCTLLLQYNDIYEKIIIIDNPEKYKQVFNELVKKINNIDVMIDELHTFIEARNAVSLKDQFQKQLHENVSKMDGLVNMSKDKVVIDSAVTREILSLYKNNQNIHNLLIDAKHILPHDYVIVKKKQNIQRDTLKHTPLTKRQKIKGPVKKLMIDVLE
jgi:hypothetical protein